MAMALLVLGIVLVPTIIQDTRMPASGELVYYEETDDSESVEVLNSSYSPVSSVTIINESLLSIDDNWEKIGIPMLNVSRFSRVIAVPYLNVSTLILRLSAFIVVGPLTISLSSQIYGWENSTTGQTGEYCEIVSHLTSDEFSPSLNYRLGLMAIVVEFEGQNWNVVDHLFFSLQAVFTDILCPITIDLQRTNGESMFLLPTFRIIHKDVHSPIISFDEFEFCLSQVNDTIFVPNGNYSLAIQWEGYGCSLTNLSITNESLHLAIRIKSVRLDVVALQNIPGYEISVDHSSLYHETFLIKDSPSFYLPSGSTVEISVRGNLPRSSTYSYYGTFLDAGGNRNVTLTVSENWILIGEIAFTPARFGIVIAAVLLIAMTVLISGKKSFSSPKYIPFILLTLGIMLPAVDITQVAYDDPTTIPLYSLYTKCYSVSPMIYTTISRMNDTATAMSAANMYGYNFGFITFILLLFAFIGVFSEYLEKDYPDFFVPGPILVSLLFQLSFFNSILDLASSYQTVTIGLGPIVTGVAFLSWIALYMRKTTPPSSQSILEELKTA